MIPLDQQNPNEDRGETRARKAKLTGIATLLARGSGILFSFLAIPLTATYLGNERFGVWLVISNFLSWIALADLGLSNSLTNEVATADAEENYFKVQQAVSSSIISITLIGIVLLVTFALSHSLVDWGKVFNVSSLPIAAEASLAAFAGCMIFVVRLPLSIPNRLYSAYQEGYIYQIWSGVGSWLSLLGLLIGTKLQVSLPGLIILFFGGIILAELLAFWHLFYKHRPHIKPRWSGFNRAVAKSLLKTGLQFWVVQVSAIVYLQTDLIIVTQLFGASAVATYGVALKLFTIIGFVQSAFLAPLWSAYTEALMRKDFSWIVKTFWRSVRLSLAWSVVGGLLLVIISPWLMTKWLGSAASPGWDLMAAMFCLVVLTAIGQCIAYFMNGLGEISGQMWYAVMAATSNVFLSILLGKLIGLSGVTWATVICIIIFSVLLVGKDALGHIRLFTAECKIGQND
jgi:O-antigen/teichoic acid export membrane protein